LASAAIAWLGWRAIGSQRQLDATAVQERRKETAAEIGRDLLARLNAIKLRAVSQDQLNLWNIDSADPDVALIGTVDGGRLVFPWDPEPIQARADAFDRAINSPEFTTLKIEADKADTRKDYDREIEIYRGLSETESDPNRKIFARLLLAGTYIRDNREA